MRRAVLEEGDAQPGDSVGASCGRGSCRIKRRGRTPPDRLGGFPGTDLAFLPYLPMATCTSSMACSPGGRMTMDNLQCTGISGPRGRESDFAGGGNSDWGQIQRRERNIHGWILDLPCSACSLQAHRRRRETPSTDVDRHASAISGHPRGSRTSGFKFTRTPRPNSQYTPFFADFC